jgi:hypothetical protein
MIVGLLAICIAAIVIGGMWLFRVRPLPDLMEVAGFAVAFIAAAPIIVIFVGAALRWLHLWPFN